MRITINNLFSTDHVVNSINHFFKKLDTSVNVVSEGKSDLELIPLHLLPTSRNRDKSVFALITLDERRNYIVIRKDIVNEGDRIGFPDAVCLALSPNFVTYNILGIRKGLKTHILEPLEILEGLRNNEIACAVVEGCFVNEGIKQHYKIIPLNEREFGHYPGQGFLALCGDANFSMGPSLRKFNIRESIISANIERKLMTMVNFKLNNHCEMDTDGNFHFWVHTDKGSVHVSQSTRNQIEERVIHKLELLS